MGGYATNPDTNATSEITGSGTANYMAKFTAAQVIGNSTVQDDGTTVSTTSLFRVGNPAVPGGSLSQMRVGIGTSYLDFGQSSSGVAAMWANTSTPTSGNWVMQSDGVHVYFNTPSANGQWSVGFGNATNLVVATNGAFSLTPSVKTSGAVTNFTFTGSANTGQTASTEINRLLLTTSSRQWNTGAITTQREVYITSPTYSFVGASTITSAYTLYVEAPTAGTNATISSPYALGLDGHLRFANSNPIISSGSAITIQSSSGANVVLNAGSSTQTYVIFRGQGTERFSLTTGTNTSAAVSYAVYSPASNTGQTASTEINGFLYNSYTRTWAAGAITNQREQYIKTVTYAFASASTITTAYSMYVEKPTAGSNATITNNYSIGTDGGIIATIGTGVAQIAQLVGVTDRVALYFGTNAPSATNYAVSCSAAAGTATCFNGASAIRLRIGDADMMQLNSTNYVFSNNSASASANTQFTFTQNAAVTQTASTEIPGFKFTGGSRQWSTGAITTQREIYFSTTTYTAVGASTITNAYGMYVEAPTASTNVTITNNYALGLSGNLNIAVNNMGVWGVDSIGTARKLIFFTNADNIQIIGRPGLSDIFIDPTASNTGALTIKAAGAIGVGAAVSPTAWLMLPAGSTGTSKAPLKFTSGTNQTTAESGAMEYNNTFHLTNSDATRRHIVLAPNTTKVTAGAPYTNDGYIVINIGGTDFKLMTTV